jgi:hypothetical protein
MAETTETQVPPVDETTIASVKANSARKNSLSNYLKHRPERSELVESTSHDAPNWSFFYIISFHELRANELSQAVWAGRGFTCFCVLVGFMFC